ncbi:hypothetical protein LCGC14_2598000, partial [marine sediment metagenome]
ERQILRIAPMLAHARLDGRERHRAPRQFLDRVGRRRPHGERRRLQHGTGVLHNGSNKLFTPANALHLCTWFDNQRYM